jgi:hypothetical protein
LTSNNGKLTTGAFVPVERITSHRVERELINLSSKASHHCSLGWGHWKARMPGTA